MPVAIGLVVILVIALLLFRATGSPRVEAPAGVTRVMSSYGDLADQWGELWLPATPGPHPVVVLVHGGFWGSSFGADLMDRLAADIAGRGWAAWNIEYRRVGGGGGWPATFEDAAAATDHLTGLAGEHDLDLNRVATVGHSAGGHLAVWLASRHRIPDGSPGAGPRVRPGYSISQAGVLDLAAGSAAGLGGGAVDALMGGSPEEHPERYSAGSPSQLAPAGVPVLLIHGRADRLVPIEQSRLYAAAAGEGATDLVALPGDHFEHLEPASAEWQAAVEGLGDFFGTPR